MPLHERDTILVDPNELWFTTSGSSTFLTSGTVTFITTAGSTIPLSSATAGSTSGSDPGSTATPTASAGNSQATGSNSGNPSGSSGSSFDTLSSTFPIRPTSTTSFSTTSSSTSDPSGLPQVAVQAGPVCIGDGMDATGGGLLATLLIPSVIGLIIWLLFAILRPKFRQLYSVREWFVQQELRPRPLSNSPLAFLWPKVPLVPSVPANVSDAGRSPAHDAELFPSDEQLSQRTLWLAFLVIAGWSVLGLAGALPLYLVNTTCLARSIPRAYYGGVYSTLQDLSLLRLLNKLDQERQGKSSGALFRRADGDSGGIGNARIRIIVLTALVTVIAVLPALHKILKEYKRLAAYRVRWIETRCGGMELGWLSIKRAPGFAGWGEKQLKDYIVKTGLGNTLDSNSGSRNGNGSSRAQRSEPSDEEKRLEVEVTSLFTITDTHKLAVLIEERDEILDNLEIAECKYIDSFKSVTPDPSIADFFAETGEQDGGRPRISRPRPLTAVARQRTGRTRNPAHGSSSYAPSSYMLPSSYYKLRRIQGVSSMQTSSTGELVPAPEQSLEDSINQRVVGSRFREIHNRPSAVWGRIPLGSQVRADEKGVLHPIDSTSTEPIPDPSRFGPNHSGQPDDTGHDGRVEPMEDWVDLMREREENADNSWYASAQSGPSERPDSATAVQTPGAGSSTPHDAHTSLDAQAMAANAAADTRRPLIFNYNNYPASHRSTFPMRHARYSELEPSLVPPPHLRVQSRGPFFRPVSGLAHDDLSGIYGDISHWRSRLKELNVQIADAQNDGYGDIAEGKDVKGWLLIGRGIRFLPGVQMIEGRAKEDIRWHELQHEGGTGNKVAIIVISALTAVALAVGLFAVAGLSLGTAPNFAHYVPFLASLRDQNDWTSGLATGLSAAIAGTLFIAGAVAILHYVTRLSTEVSISARELTSFQMTFWVITVVGFIFLTVVGAVLFAVRAINLHDKRSATIANGSVYMSALLLAFILNVAIIAPGLLLLQPVRLWKIQRAERHAITPRHRFRSIYPRGYNPTFAMGCCILAIIIASAFSLLFPLIGPAAAVLLILTLVAHRFLVGYVYVRTRSQTGGLLQMWILRRFATMTALQPLILGLILLSRRLWPEGGVLCGFSLAVILLAEAYCTRKLRLPGPDSLGPMTRNSIETFKKTAKPGRRSHHSGEESTGLVGDRAGGISPRARGSFASVLEMMSITLAVMPGTKFKGPIPLQTETVDDLTATERAARSHPDAPPHLPPLPFADHADEIAGILYAPELIAPPPTIWLPNDRAGVARGEAYDLQRYHNLRATVDVRSKDDVVAFRNHGRKSSGEERAEKAEKNRTSKR